MFNMANNMMNMPSMQNMQNMQNMGNMQNMANMQNMMTMYNNMRMNQVFNPAKVDKSSKRTWINNNISQARVGWFQKFSKCDSLSIPYSPCDPGKADSICEVKVIYEHALDVAKDYAEVDAQTFTKANKMNPAVLNVVGKEFTGDNFESSEEIRDEMMNIRTTFCANPIKSNIFPIKEQHCVHTPYVNVIRPKDPRSVFSWKMCYRVGFITACPISQESSSVKKMSSSDFVKTCTIIENVFQIAIGLNHQVLILTPFGHEEDNNPIEDIIKIYNFCIMKYGHKLKSVIIAIPPYYPKNLFTLYSQNIVKPNELVQEVDNKYDGLVVQKKIQEKLSNKRKDTESESNSDSEQNNKTDESSNKNFNNNNQMQQMQMFMKMIQSNPNMMAAMLNKK
jgi:hypothetical protein